jgi:hypothetical protein
MVFLWTISPNPGASRARSATAQIRAARTGWGRIRQMQGERQEQHKRNQNTRAPCPRLLHQTGSPGANLLPGHSAVMVPTRSRPTTNGRGIGVGYRPDRMQVSAGLTADTSTATRTTVGPSTGTGSSLTCIASGSLVRCYTRHASWRRSHLLVGRYGRLDLLSLDKLTWSARNSSQVRRPTAGPGARLAPARTARAALPGSQTGMIGRCR